ncbi:MAG: glucans biosynthesis glucosyltransferase MdoH, partial [Microvirga sp.]
EQAAWTDLVSALQASQPEGAAPVRLFYRWRQRRTKRKAGNVSDFARRWGKAYGYMVVLDADSLMTGECLTTLVRLMEANPEAGILQTAPRACGHETFHARVLQFGSRAYGPLFTAGMHFWQLGESHYWGHNAILRMQPFIAHCGLPALPGNGSLSGEVLSHDFVEAALMRRAGYTVYMLHDLPGSYEESPPSLIDVAARDRRWCQGNLQHSRIIGARGLKLATRQHFATGIMSYLASPFWLFQLIVGIALVLQTTYIRPEYFSREFTLFPQWPRFDPERALALFGVTMAVLLAPKFFGLVLMLLHAEGRRRAGGAVRLVASTLIEILLSALMAPILMVIQSGSVFQILLGRDTGWQPQRRDDGSIPLRDIVRRHRWHTVLGLLTGVSAFMIATSLFLWMSPTIVGLVLAIPLSWLSGRLGAGLALKRLGLLMIPEETRTPPVVERANALLVENRRLGFDDADGLLALYQDTRLRQSHEAMLPPAPARRRGDIDPERVIAQAKIMDAATIHDAAHWLKPKERMVVLHDRALLDQLTRLKPVAEAAEAAE